MERQKPGLLFPPLSMMFRTLPSQPKPRRASRSSISKHGISPISAKRDKPQPKVYHHSSVSPIKKRDSLTPIRVRSVRGEIPTTAHIVPVPVWTLAEIRFQKCIGKGSMGKIMAAEARDMQIAIKIMSKKPAKVKKVADAEKFALEQLQHPLIVHYFGCIEDENHVYFLLEKLQRGDLFHITKRKRLKPKEIKFFAGEVLAVLKFMHGKGIVYRDLKPENVMLHDNGHIRLVDFGFAKKVDGERTNTSLGSPEYMSPELVLKQPHSYPSDLWSFGILLYEFFSQYILRSHPPFQGSSPVQVYEKIVAGRYEIPPQVDSSAKDLIRRLLAQDARTRPKAEDAMSHQYFRGVDWEAVETGEADPPALDERGEGEIEQFQTDIFDEF